MRGIKIGSEIKGRIEQLYHNEKLPMTEVAKRLNLPEGSLKHLMQRLGIPTRSRSEAGQVGYETGRIRIPHSVECPNWKGGRIKTSGGYIMVRQPGHPRASVGGGKYVMEHILIWERVHNRSLPQGWVVHHLNGITDDNRPENLVGFPSKKHYGILEAKAKRIRELEAKVELLGKALEAGQMIFRIEEN